MTEATRHSALVFRSDEPCVARLIDPFIDPRVLCRRTYRRVDRLIDRVSLAIVERIGRRGVEQMTSRGVTAAERHLHRIDGAAARFGQRTARME